MITCVQNTYPPEFRGLSTDNKNSIESPVNGSIFFEFDLGKIYIYNIDTETWGELILG